MFPATVGIPPVFLIPAGGAVCVSEESIECFIQSNFIRAREHN